MLQLTLPACLLDVSVTWSLWSFVVVVTKVLDRCWTKVQLLFFCFIRLSAAIENHKKLMWPWELPTPELKKTHADRHNTRKLRKHLYQFDNTTHYRNALQPEDTWKWRWLSISVVVMKLKHVLWMHCYCYELLRKKFCGELPEVVLFCLS